MSRSRVLPGRRANARVNPKKARVNLLASNCTLEAFPAAVVEFDRLLVIVCLSMKVDLMRSRVLLFCLATALLHSLGGACLSEDSYKKEKAAIAFGNVKYFHRFTQNDQHEYMPAGQEDLNLWKDM